MKHQFFIIYSLRNSNAFSRFSCGIEVEYAEELSANEKFLALTKATAINHNSIDNFHGTSRKIDLMDVAFHTIVKI